MIVTVITPTLDAMSYLPACVQSARSQKSDRVDVEHVVVDGGSSDGTVEFARSAGCTVLTGKDEGIFDAINKGSFNSNGALLGFLGADDILRSDAAHLAEIEAIAERFGPSAPWQRLAYRYFLKLWLNGGSLPWFARKRIDAVRAR